MTPELFVIYAGVGILIAIVFAAWCGYAGNTRDWPLGIVLGVIWPSLLIAVPILALMWVPFRLGEALRRKP